MFKQWFKRIFTGLILSLTLISSLSVANALGFDSIPEAHACTMGNGSGGGC